MSQLASKLKLSVEDIIKSKTTPKTKPEERAETIAFNEIENNPFHKVIFNKSLENDEKSLEITKLLTENKTQEEFNSMIRQLETFKEYLQYKRKEMNQKLISLNDTDAFGELNKMFGDLNNGLLEFEEKMSPLTELVDAFFKIRQEGEDAAYNLFKEIKQEEQEEKTYNDRATNLQNQINDKRVQLTALGNDIAYFSQDTNWFGSVKSDSARAIVEKKSQMKILESEISNLTNEVSALTPPSSAQDNGEWGAIKQKIRENLLALTTEEHQTKQKDLINSANEFINISSERVASLRDTFTGIKSHQGKLGVISDNMMKTYAIINEGVVNATTTNQERFDELSKTDTNSLTVLKKMELEKNKELYGRVIKKLDETRMDSEENYSDLATQSIRIKNLEEATDQQLSSLRRMHSQGIAGVADRLNTVLSAVFSAAGSEAGAVADNTIRQMRKYTDEIAQKESIRIATAYADNNVRINEIVEEVTKYKAVNDERNSIMRDVMAESKAALTKLEEASKGIVESVQESIMENATSTKTETKTVKAPTTKDDDFLGM